LITWITGQPNTGKTTLGKYISEQHNVILLDGDELRPFIQDSTYEMFTINLAYIANILSKQGHDVVISARVRESRTEINKICNPEWIDLDKLSD